MVGALDKRSRAVELPEFPRLRVSFKSPEHEQHSEETKLQATTEKHRNVGRLLVYLKYKYNLDSVCLSPGNKK